MPALRDVLDLIHDWYPPATAESWDAVGLVLGDPDRPVKKVLLAVDPAPAVAAEAAEWKADLLLVHHPLFLKPVHGFPATTPKGRTLATLAGAGCALLTAHTNADQAAGGVSESLARALGLTDLEPLVPAAGEPIDKLTVYVPSDAAAPVRAAMAEAGAGRIGDYDFASYTSEGEGRFRPLDGANPMIGAVGEIATVPEARIEVVLARHLRRAVVEAMLAAHPYEEPAYDVVELADPGNLPTGTGRVGAVPATTLGKFARHVAAVLPPTQHGVRVAGDPERTVRKVAVCGGAGDFLLDRVAGTDVDAYLTSDLRHHPASEFVEKGGPALLDVAHWAAEWTWLPVVEERLRSALGGDVETRVSTTCTDPLDNAAMKADPFAQRKLLDLQALDAEADQLRHQRAHLPEDAEITDLTSRRDQLVGRSRDQQIVVDDLTAAQAKADADVEQVKARRQRDRDRMDQGLITNPKDLERMQHELQTLERRIATLEDEELEVMQQLEDAQEELTTLQEELAAIEEKLAGLQESRSMRRTEIDAELSRVSGARLPVVADVPEDLLALYERLRANKGGVGAAELRARQCGGCMLTLDNAEIAQIRTRPSDDVVRCEECQRILVRTDESGL